jgi:3-oxoadipate enol-lactonase
MAFVESRGRRIYYERHGQGPAVLFLHGAGSNAATWWQQLPAFGARHTCLTMDIRCFGRSVAPLEEFTLDNFVADALAVLDREDVERASSASRWAGSSG